MLDHIDTILIDREQIAERVQEMARAIAADFRRDSRGQADPQLTIIAVLTGSLVFLADLVRHLPVMVRLRLVTVSSYPGSATTSQGPRLEGPLPGDLSGQHVLIVDDILDSGKTLRFVRHLLVQRNPASLRSCMLLRKMIPSAMAEHADYVGFDIPDAFVVGYGLDYDGYYRNLPDVVTLKPEKIK
jgi:hypoxanthine phosphoribosyltransferase